MLNISNYLRNKLLDEAISAVAFTPAATLYLRAFSTTLTNAGAGTELSGDGYAPLEIDNNATNFPAAAGGAKSNNVQFDGSTATADWDEILAFGLFDDDTAGNLYFYENLDTPLQINDGQNFFFEIADITFLFQ